MKNLFSFSSILMLAIALWVFGFLTFVVDLNLAIEPDSADLAPTDAIVVLTGGSERVSTGVELLQSGVAKKLFISGVHKKLSLDQILSPHNVAPDLRQCCITLGYQAGSTIGNAEETHEFMVAEDYHSLRLVTANYHMPRSLLLFHHAMPDIEIIPHPVAPDSVKLHEWWEHPRTIELLATEYTKYLLASFQLWVGH